MVLRWICPDCPSMLVGREFWLVRTVEGPDKWVRKGKGRAIGN